MIKKVQLSNIKCFEDLEIPFSNLTLLSGINSMGKSTLIQTLLLTRQSFELSKLTGLHLNGPYTQIGVGKDLLNCSAGGEDNFFIKMYTNNRCLEQYIHYKQESDFLSTTTQLLLEDDTLMLLNPNCFESFEKKLSSFNLFQRNFCFLSAERIAPQMYYSKSYYDVHVKKQIGIHGEYTIHYLEDNSEVNITNPFVLHENNKNTHLLSQVESWLSEISPGTKLDFDDNKNANIIGLQIQQAGKKNDINHKYNAVNVGFGISYILPVITALIKAEKDDLIIIENPEAHLHPKGQRKMGELIARAANGGVQIIIETHSDHLLNGIRLSVRNNIISSDKVELYYFRKNEDNNSIYENPKILNDGMLNFWPEGFFDEWDKAIDEMF